MYRAAPRARRPGPAAESHRPMLAVRPPPEASPLHRELRRQERRNQSLCAWRASAAELYVRYVSSFHTYKKLPSLAVATRRPLFLVARFSADRTFSLLWLNCASGTFNATPFF